MNDITVISTKNLLIRMKNCIDNRGDTIWRKYGEVDKVLRQQYKGSLGPLHDPGFSWIKHNLSPEPTWNIKPP